MSTGLKSIKNIFTEKLFFYLLSLVCIGVLAFEVFTPYLPYSIPLVKGQVAPRTIYSPAYKEVMTEEDQLRNEELRLSQSQHIPDIYSVEPEISREVISQITGFYTAVGATRALRRMDPHSRIPKALHFLDYTQLKYVLNIPVPELTGMQDLNLKMATYILDDGLREVNARLVWDRLQKELESSAVPPVQFAIVHQVLLQYLTPNMRLDVDKTAAARKRAYASFKPFKTIIQKDEPIIYEGEKVQDYHIEKLKALNLYGVKTNYYRFLGILLMAVLVWFILERYVFFFHHELVESLRAFTLIYLLMVVVLGITRVCLLLPGNVGFDPVYVIPMSILSIVISTLINSQIAFLTGSLIAILGAAMHGGDMTLFMFMFLANAAAVFSTHKIYFRQKLIKSSYAMGVLNVIIVVMIGFFQEVASISWYATNGIAAFLNGVVSAMFSLAALPYIEELFHITTSQTLLEQSNLNHPLMKRLMMEAPGTYQHSLMVANLAETAAEAIDANMILARTGAYFHDIGKMKRVTFYTENQFSGENPHKTLSPRMSKIIIASHTRDGVELARKYKIPLVIRKFMIEHHGSGLVSFFYLQALKMEEKADPDALKEEFRYNGTLPSFKESGIVMLADSVEAAIRSMEKPTQLKIENLISRIFKEKIDDGQLGNCPLTLREIELIKHAFIRFFKAVYHHRINYADELNYISEAKARKDAIREGI